MNEISRPLEEITAEAKVIYNRIKKDYAEWGRLMVEAKELVPHGQWGAYLAQNFPEVGDRQARRYMELAKDDTKVLTEITHPERNPKRSLETDLNSLVKAEASIETELEPPPAAKVMDEVVGRIAKYNWNGADISKLKELIKHRDQYTPIGWETAKDAVRRAIESLTEILKEMEND